MDIVGILFYVVVLVFSVILHELAHGLVAYSMGDTTAKDAGRLTLNPIPHIDLFGSILLPLLTYQFGFLVGYAKPVPYNPYNLNDRKYGPAKVAAAGPLANLFLAVLFGLVLRFVPDQYLAPQLQQMFTLVVLLNLQLMVFNLVPIQPLDGHWLLLTFLPDRFQRLKYFMVQYGVFFLILFIVFFLPILRPLIQFLFSVIVGK